MTTIHDEISRVERGLQDVREVIELGFGSLTPDQHHDSYARILSQMFVGNATSHLLSTTPRITADGMPIYDGIALVNAIYGNSISQLSTLNSQLISVQDFTLHSKDTTATTIGQISIEPSTALAPDGAPLFPYGMNGNDIVRDVFGSTQDIRHYGYIDLGTLTWKASANHSVYPNLYHATVTKSMKDAKVGMANEVQNLITAKYTPTSYSLIATADYKTYHISLYKSGTSITLSIQDRDCNNLTSFLHEISGQILFYQLEQPIVVDHPLRNPIYSVANGGTEHITSTIPCAPVVADIAYRESVTASQALALLHDTALL